MVAVLLVTLSAALHAAYAVIRQRAYGHSDLSVVYPVSRATVLGMLLLREPRTASTLGGTAVILTGVLTIAAA